MFMLHTTYFSSKTTAHIKCVKLVYSFCCHNHERILLSDFQPKRMACFHKFFYSAFVCVRDIEKRKEDERLA